MIVKDIVWHAEVFGKAIDSEETLNASTEPFRGGVGAPMPYDCLDAWEDAGALTVTETREE